MGIGREKNGNIIFEGTEELWPLRRVIAGRVGANLHDLSRYERALKRNESLAALGKPLEPMPPIDPRVLVAQAIRRHDDHTGKLEVYPEEASMLLELASEHAESLRCARDDVGPHMGDARHMRAPNSFSRFLSSSKKVVSGSDLCTHCIRGEFGTPFGRRRWTENIECLHNQSLNVRKTLTLHRK